MNISSHTATDPDTAMADVRTAGQPLGVLVGEPVVDGDAIAFALWPGAGPGRYRLTQSLAGTADGVPTHMQVVEFDGPRTAQWAAAEERAGTERIWPAVRGVAGLHRVLLMKADDNATVTVILAGGTEPIDAAARAIMSTTLLPGEDPALLTGPDRVGVYRLRQADLPETMSMMEV